MTCPAAVNVAIPGPPGIGLPSGVGFANYAVVKDGSTPYLYKLVELTQVGLPQALGITASPTFAGLTLSSFINQSVGIVTSGLNGQLARVSIGNGLSIVNGALVASITSGTNLGYEPATRLLSSSTGDDVTLPLATISVPGLQSGADKAKLDSITIDVATRTRQPVRNTTGALIPKGSVVRVPSPGSSGTHLLIALADASNESTAANTLGLAESDVDHNSNGFVLTEGEIDGLNTDHLVEGGLVFLSETTGQTTSTRPTQPAHGVILGWCKKKGPGTSGSIYVKVDNGQEINELHDVLITGNPPAVGAAKPVLALSPDGLWRNTVLTPVDVGADATLAALNARLNAFRDAATFYVSKRITASDSNNGTSPGEPFLTIGVAVAAAKAYITANPNSYAKIEVGSGSYTEANLPFRTGPKVYAKAQSQRNTIIKPAAGQELNGFFALDSECMLEGFRFAGHQATGTSSTDSSVGTRAWAVRFDELANGGLGPIIYASPYIKDCASITAEDDEGLAGSLSTGDTGGGVEVDGAKVHPNSPVRSMVVYGFTQQNLGGPGVVVKNDAYAELVSFFGLFCTWHVQCETGGWATLSGGGCSEFGLYGIVADGYSATALYTGLLRVAALAGDTTIDVVSMTANRLGSSNRPHNGQIILLGGVGYVVTSGTPIDASGNVVADSAPTRAGYRVGLYNPTGVGLTSNATQGATVDFRRRSQVSAGCHTALFVGSGTNYSALPWNGGVPIRANTFVERNFGRVFGLSVNDAGDIYAAGGAFAVDGTTGSVTINTDEFNLSGLNAIGPFSRNGGFSTVGVQLQEVSNNTSLLASTGTSDGNTAPTQFAVRTFADNRYLAGLTVTSGQGISITDTSTQDGSGFWTRSRNISLSLNTDIVPELQGAVNLYFTTARGQSAASSWWAGYRSSIGDQLATAATQAAARSTIGAGTSSVALSANPAQGLGATAAAGSSGQAADAAHVHQRDSSIFPMPLTGNSDPVGSPTTLINRAVLPVGGTFLGVALDCETAISGAAFIVNITLNGTTIFSTKPQINVGGNATGNTPVLSITTFAPGDVIRAYIDQASGGGRFANITFTVRRSS